MPLIDQMYAFVVEEAPGDEGIPAFQRGGLWYPLVGADMERIEALRPMAQQIASATGRDIRLLRFSNVEEVEIIEPEQG